MTCSLTATPDRKAGRNRSARSVGRRAATARGSESCMTVRVERSANPVVSTTTENLTSARAEDAAIELGYSPVGYRHTTLLLNTPLRVHGSQAGQATSSLV